MSPNRYGFRSLARVLVGFASIAPLAAQQSSLPQPGVYHCTNGIILTISRCGKVQGLDACNFKIENNGKVLMDTPGSASGVSKILAKCKDPAEGPQGGTSASGTSGATNPPYLSEMPAPTRILAAIKGKDAEDTGERQMGAFRALVQIIDDMAWGLSHRYVNDADSRKATPDEQRLRFAYETAYADLWHKVTNKEGHVYDHDLDLQHELLQKFFTENFRAQYFQSNKNAAAEYAAFQKKMYPNPQTGAAQNGPAGQHYAQDAGSVAVRKCVESGRSELECLGEGMKIGLVDLSGDNPLYKMALTPNQNPGLRLTGLYSTANFGIRFNQSSASVVCGTLVPQDFSYSVERAGGVQLLVKIPINPKPVVLSYQADGKLAGPGPIDVAGQVIVGTQSTTSTSYEAQTQTTMQSHEIDAAQASNYAGTDAVQQNGMTYSVNEPMTSTSYNPVVTHHQSVRTAPKTERCNVVALAPAGSNVSMSGFLTQVLGSQGSKSANTAPGLRMNGTYAAQGGLAIEFRDDSATLECGAAQNSEGYVVVPEGGQLVVKFDNKTGPLSLVLQPNGSLAGQGTIDVTGRRIIQGTGNDPNHFVPFNARCTVGTLSAQASAQN